VPLKTGIREISALRERGINVVIVTNSLAANNQKIVHGGYAPSRKPLLQMGVRIFEVRADATVSGAVHVAAESTRTTLHTKAFVVDRRQLFIGSFNFDPRVGALCGSLLSYPANPRAVVSVDTCTIDQGKSSSTTHEQSK